MEGHLLMSTTERERLKLFEKVQRGEMSVKEAAGIGGLSYRQTRRLYKRYRADGDRGLVHQGRGRPSNRALGAEFKATVLARYQERYPDFGPTLATEKLALDGHLLDHETLRGWLIKAGLWQKRRKRSDIAAGGNEGRTSVSWCNWMARITSGLRSEHPKLV